MIALALWFLRPSQKRLLLPRVVAEIRRAHLGSASGKTLVLGCSISGMARTVFIGRRAALTCYWCDGENHETRTEI